MVNTEETPINRLNHEYVGDGVYLEYDPVRYQFVVKANHHQFPTDKVYLDIDVWEKARAWIDRRIEILESGEDE